MDREKIEIYSCLMFIGGKKSRRTLIFTFLFLIIVFVFKPRHIYFNFGDYRNFVKMKIIFTILNIRIIIILLLCSV